MLLSFALCTGIGDAHALFSPDSFWTWGRSQRQLPSLNKRRRRIKCFAQDVLENALPHCRDRRQRMRMHEKQGSQKPTRPGGYIENCEIFASWEALFDAFYRGCFGVPWIMTRSQCFACWVQSSISVCIATLYCFHQLLSCKPAQNMVC